MLAKTISWSFRYATIQYLPSHRRRRSGLMVASDGTHGERRYTSPKLDRHSYKAYHNSTVHSPCYFFPFFPSLPSSSSRSFRPFSTSLASTPAFSAAASNAFWSSESASSNSAREFCILFSTARRQRSARSTQKGEILTEIVQRENRPDQTTQKHHHQPIIRLSPKRPPLQPRLLRLPIQVRQQVEDILQMIHDLMIHRELAPDDERKVVPDLDQA